MKLIWRRGRKSNILLLSNSLTFARAPVDGNIVKNRLNNNPSGKLEGSIDDNIMWMIQKKLENTESVFGKSFIAYG